MKIQKIWLLAMILWSVSKTSAAIDWATFGFSARCLDMRGQLAKLQLDLKERLDQILAEIGACEALAELNCAIAPTEDPREAIDRCHRSKEEFARRKAELNAEIGQIARTKADSESLVLEECAKRVY